MKYKVNMIPVGITALVVGAAVGYSECRKEPAKKEEVSINWGYFAVSPQEFTNIYESSLKVNRSLMLEEKCDGSLEINHFASGILLRDSQTEEDYILTAEHITVNQTYGCEEEGSSKKYIKVKGGSVSVAGFSAHVVKESEKADLALLKIEGNIAATPYQGKIAGRLYLGEVVIGTGYPDGERPYSISYVKEIKKNITILSFENKGGNSGGGFYRFTNQGLELIGTTRGGKTITTLERLQELIKGTPLEDDYLK